MGLINEVMSSTIDKLKFKGLKLSAQEVEGLKATSLLVIGSVFVGLLFLLSSGGEVIEDTKVQNIATSDTITQSIENTYELSPVEYIEPEITNTVDTLDSTNEFAYDNTGEVLGAGDCTPNFVYERQWSCYKGNTAPTACEEVESEDEEGNKFISAFCGSAMVDVRVMEDGITYPKLFLEGVNADAVDEDKKEWAEQQVIASCYDKETGERIPGMTCFNSLGSGGDPVSDYERDPALKSASPILAKELWDLHEKTAEEEPTVKSFYKMQIASEDDDHGGYFLSTKNINEQANSPQVALDVSALGGIPQRSPLSDQNSRNFGNECDSSKGAKVEYIELPNDRAYIDEVNCKYSSTGAAEQDITMNVRSWVECKLAPNSAPCVYRLSEYILVNSLWGTPFQCRDGQCPMMGYDYTMSSLTAPGSPELQVDGLDMDAASESNAVYQTQYITTPCKIEYKDYSKLAPQWKEVQLKCLWAVPHTRKLEEQTAESAPGVYPDTETWLKLALDEAAGSDYFVSQDPQISCGGI